MGQVGGSALPGGVMMRTRRRVGIAVRHDETGEILTDSFDEELPKGRWARWPMMRGIVAMRVALSTGQKAMSLSERLRWEPRPLPGEEPAPAGASGVGAEAEREGEGEGRGEGVGVWITGVVVTIAMVVLGAIFGNQYDIQNRVNLPRLPVTADALTTGGVVAALAVLVGTLVAARQARRRRSGQH